MYIKKYILKPLLTLSTLLKLCFLFHCKLLISLESNDINLNNNISETLESNDINLSNNIKESLESPQVLQQDVIKQNNIKSFLNKFIVTKYKISVFIILSLLCFFTILIINQFGPEYDSFFYKCRYRISLVFFFYLNLSFIFSFYIIYLGNEINIINLIFNILFYMILTSLVFDLYRETDIYIEKQIQIFY
jgi:hypothetical protein